MNVFQFVAQNHGEVLRLTLEHLWMVLASTLLAVVIGIPLGILISRRPGWNKPVLGSANVIQTIPSLALFGFLLPVPWIGARSGRLAILALDPVCASTPDSQHVRGHQKRGPCNRRSGTGDGHDGMAIAVARRIALGSWRDHCWSTRGDGHFGRPGDDCGSDWGGGARRIYFSRSQHGQQSTHSCGSDSGRLAGIAGRRFFGVARKAIEPHLEIFKAGTTRHLCGARPSYPCSQRYNSRRAARRGKARS